MSNKPRGGGWPRPNKAKAARKFVAELAKVVRERREYPNEHSEVMDAVLGRSSSSDSGASR